MSERISIAIPFVEGIAYLREAVASALAQTRPADEVAVVDNTRDPAERARLDALAAEFAPRSVRLLRLGEHVSAVRNFDRALAGAGGDLVTLLHADDALMPGYLDTIERLAAEYPDAALYFCGAAIVDDAGRPRRSFVDAMKRFIVPARRGRIVLRGEAGVRALAFGNFIMCPTVCFRRAALRGERWTEDFVQVADYDLWMRLLFAGATIVGTTEVAFRYRRHAAQTTAVNNATLFRYRDELAVHESVARRARLRGWRVTALLLRLALPTRLLLAVAALGDVRSLRLHDAFAKLRLMTGER